MAGKQRSLPNDEQHTFIVGMNGTGKTQAGMFLLSSREWDRIPWVVYDFKKDKLLAEMTDGIAVEIPLDRTPDKPGLYIYRPDVMSDTWKDEVNASLKRIWEQENTGIYIDEGFQIRRTESLQALLMQGRAKKIPLIVGFQRPVGISKELRTEAQFYQIFFLANSDDRKELQQNMSDEAKYFIDRRIPKYHSVWYEQATGEAVILTPVPDKRDIRLLFERRKADMEKKVVRDGKEFVVV